MKIPSRNPISLPKWAGVVEIDEVRHRVRWARLSDVSLGHAIQSEGLTPVNAQRIAEFAARVVPSLPAERVAQLELPELVAIIEASTGSRGGGEG